MDLPIRILFVIDSLAFGGAQRQLVELIKSLPGRSHYNIHLVSLLPRNAGYSDLIEKLGLKIQYFPRKARWDILFPLLRLANYIYENNIDIVHCFMNMGSLFGGLAAKLTRRPTVCSAIRDAKDITVKAKYFKRFLSYISDSYVANSRAGFENRFVSIKPHFRVVYNGVDFGRFQNRRDTSELRKALGIDKDARVVGMVGSLSQNKDHDTLLSAASAVLRKFPTTIFLIVGGGETYSHLLERVKALNICQNVVFTGYRSDADDLYPLMDICVLLTNTKKHLEGIPNTIIEAMACGIPVIASHGGGTSEIVKDRENGILVRPHDSMETAEAIVGIFNNRSWGNSLASAARSWVHKEFDSARYVENYENIYEELLEKRG